MPKRSLANKTYKQRVAFQRANRPIQTLPQNNMHSGTVDVSSLLGGRYLDSAQPPNVFSNASKSKRKQKKN